jgi:hypothetical protein
MASPEPEMEAQQRGGMKVDRQPVSSSNLVSVGYDLDNETLEVEFVNGSVYRYLNIPLFEYERLMSSVSLGGYFNANIRNGYTYERA